MVFGCRLDHRIDVISVSLSGCQRLEEDCPATLASYIAVCCLIKGPGFSIAAQHSSHAKRDERGGTQHYLYSAHNRHIATASVHGFYCPMQSNQRTGAGGIQRDTGTFQIEVKGNAVGQCRHGGAHRHIGIDLVALVAGRLDAEVIVHE